MLAVYTLQGLHSIVHSITTDKRILELIGKMKPMDLQSDLLSHCKEELYRVGKKYPGKIETLHADNKLFAFFSGLIRNQHCSQTSTFYRRLRKKGNLPSNFIHQEVSRISIAQREVKDHAPTLTDSQQTALGLIYQRIETAKTVKKQKDSPKKLTGNAYRMSRLEKTLSEIKEIKILIEAFQRKPPSKSILAVRY